MKNSGISKIIIIMIIKENRKNVKKQNKKQIINQIN